MNTHARPQPGGYTSADDAATMGGKDPLARAVSPYTAREKIARALWYIIGQPLFRLTFHNWYGARAALLRAFGARLARDVRLRPSVIVEQPWNLTMGENSAIGDRSIVYCLGPITIGRHVTISHGCHLCAGTHDFTRSDLPLLRPPVTLEDDCWLGADVFIGPNVTVGRGAIIGARSAVFKDAEGGWIHLGNPARKTKPRPAFTDVSPQAQTR